MNIDMTVVEFSDEVRERASSLNRRVRFKIHRHSELLWAISSSGMDLRQSSVYANPACRSPVKLQECIEDEKRTQAVLDQNGIVDDESAIAFMNLVEPQIDQWRIQYQGITDRHEAEIKVFLEGIK